MTISRRSLITGLVSLVAAPAIVRASSLMPVKAWAPEGGVFLADLSYDDRLAVAVLNLKPGGLNFVEPYPGWRFRTLPTGGLVHEPDPAAIFVQS